MRESTVSEEQYGLVKIHDRLKTILDEFTGLCDRYGINYSLAYGTLLGAARHKDFIPWDDDIDLMMRRNDYNKLISIYKNGELGKFKLDSIEVNPEYINLFAKVVFIDDEDIKFKQNFTHKDGLCLDVFPVDECDNPKSVMHWIRFKRIKVMKRAAQSKYKFVTKKESIIMKILRIIYNIPFLFSDRESLMSRANILCTFQDGLNRKYVCNFTGKYGIDISTMDKSLLSNTHDTKLLFRGSYYKVPDQYERMLTHIYGNNWNELPPMDMRKTHTALFS